MDGGSKAEIELLLRDKIVADLNKKNFQLRDQIKKLEKTAATASDLSKATVSDLAQKNRQLTNENKKLKSSAAKNGAVLAKEQAEKENLKEAYSKLEKENVHIAEDCRRVGKEKSDMEQTLAMLQVCFSSAVSKLTVEFRRLG